MFFGVSLFPSDVYTNVYGLDQAIQELEQWEATLDVDVDTQPFWHALGQLQALHETWCEIDGEIQNIKSYTQRQERAAAEARMGSPVQ